MDITVTDTTGTMAATPHGADTAITATADGTAITAGNRNSRPCASLTTTAIGIDLPAA